MTFFFRLENKLLQACTIPDLGGELFIITGGLTRETFIRLTAEVSVYNEDGWQSSLTELNQPRSAHGCASFIKDGLLVQMLKIYSD